MAVLTRKQIQIRNLVQELAKKGAVWRNDAENKLNKAKRDYEANEDQETINDLAEASERIAKSTFIMFIVSTNPTELLPAKGNVVNPATVLVATSKMLTKDIRHETPKIFHLILNYLNPELLEQFKKYEMTVGTDVDGNLTTLDIDVYNKLKQSMLEMVQSISSLADVREKITDEMLNDEQKVSPAISTTEDRKKIKAFADKAYLEDVNPSTLASNIWFQAKIFSYWYNHFTRYLDNPKQIDFTKPEYNWFIREIPFHMDLMEKQITFLKKNIAYK